LPTTPDAFQPTNARGFDGAVIQLDTNGHLAFSSYLGGSGDEALGNPTLDHHDNLYAGSVTSSKDFPVSRTPSSQTSAAATSTARS
jgi:hypothetical protein